MGAELRAAAMSHLEEISDQAILKMAESGTVATILPTTAYLLHLKHPPVRQMISAGVSVALGTDFNPNAYCLSMVCTLNMIRSLPTGSEVLVLVVRYVWVIAAIRDESGVCYAGYDYERGSRRCHYQCRCQCEHGRHSWLYRGRQGRRSGDPRCSTVGRSYRR